MTSSFVFKRRTARLP